MVPDLVDYLNNNLLIALYCRFDIGFALPPYWIFDRFLKDLDHAILSEVMLPQADSDCILVVYTASNQSNEKKYEFYWGRLSVIDRADFSQLLERTHGA